ncbi:hypothetical protein BD413DRAFT_611566 [Trametes elegans]|nr:hypothetical protein BD413DRAFT_611566 [Trametes elegans]
MVSSFSAHLGLVAGLASLVSRTSAHAAFWHLSMYGLNVTDQTFPTDNRPQSPLSDLPLAMWFHHGHTQYPPNDGDVFELPAGGLAHAYISCDKGATPFYASSQGGAVGYGSNEACPGAPPSAIHATGLDDSIKGTALSIAYKSDIETIRPEDFTVFSVNHTSPWFLNTYYQVPRLPACDGYCHCAFHWIIGRYMGSPQMYMNTFRCQVTGDVGSQPIGKPAVPRRCGPDPELNRPAVPENCTVGAKQPMYWHQAEGSNMFEDPNTPPAYNALYGFADGAQWDIFQDGVIASEAGSTPSPTSQPPSGASVSVSVPVSSAITAVTDLVGGVTGGSSSSPDAPPVSNTPEHTPSSTPEAASTPEPTGAPAPSAEPSTEDAPAPSSTRRCKVRPTDGVPAQRKRRHARHLGGFAHTL